MKGTQFAQFSAEVLRRGAAAVLPQHLPDRWLDALLEEADLFAPGAWDQTVPRLTLLVKSQWPNFNIMRVGFIGRMSSVSLAFSRRMHERFAQFISICRWLQLIYKDRLAPLENVPFSPL